MATATALSSIYRVGDVADPPTVEKMRHQVRSDGLALFDGAYGVEAMLAVAGRMMYITAHPDSDDRSVTTIVELGPAADQPNAGGFSRRELMAHTDRSGVPDPPSLMMLTCTVQAQVGGASQFTDGLAVHDDLAANCPESLQALSRTRPALFGGAVSHLGAVFTPVPGPGPARVAIRPRLDDLRPGITHESLAALDALDGDRVRHQRVRDRDQTAWIWRRGPVTVSSFLPVCGPARAGVSAAMAG